jgi:hypothetical protein
MLFILAMDPLQWLLDLAMAHNVLMGLHLATKWRTSMYANDAAIFISPKKEGIGAIKIILEAFGKAPWLRINMDKSSVHPIRCENTDLDHVLLAFSGTRGNFPYQYLVLQLHNRTLQKIHV